MVPTVNANMIKRFSGFSLCKSWICVFDFSNGKYLLLDWTTLWTLLSFSQNHYSLMIVITK